MRLEKARRTATTIPETKIVQYQGIDVNILLHVFVFYDFILILSIFVSQKFRNAYYSHDVWKLHTYSIKLIYFFCGIVKLK